MTNRRSMLKTLGALGLALVVPVGRALGYCRGARVVINGVSLELPRKLHIRIEVDPDGAQMDFVRLEVVGGRLAITHDGPAVHVIAKERGGIDITGSPAIFVVNEDDNAIECGIVLQGTPGDYPLATSCTQSQLDTQHLEQMPGCYAGLK